MIIALILIVQHFMPVNSKIITVNVTYGPQGRFVSEMVMVPKKQYEELQTEFHNMETDNMNLVHQLSMARAKPLSYYENQLNEIENESNNIENQDSSHIRELKRNSPGFVPDTTSNQVTKIMKNISKNEFNTISVQTMKTTKNIPKDELNVSKNEFNTTISVQTMKTTKNIPKDELNVTISTQNKAKTTNTLKLTFSKSNSSQGIETTINIPKQELNTTILVKETKPTMIFPEVEFNMTNTSKIIKTTIIVPKNEYRTTISIQEIKLRMNTTQKHEFNTKNSSQIMKTMMKNISNSNHKFNTTTPLQHMKTGMTFTKQKFNKTSKKKEKKKQKFNTLVQVVETTTDDYAFVSNTSAEEKILQLLKEANQLNRGLQKEMNNLKRQCNETNNFLFEFNWKILIIQTIADYEADFEKLELRQVQPRFQLNQTLVNKTLESWKYDHLAERRRQRWEFYLKTSPYCDNSFEHLAKRIERSNYSIEEFCRTLATFYKLITFDSHLETVKSAKLACGSLSQYQKMHFVIATLLEDYPKTELTEIEKLKTAEKDLTNWMKKIEAGLKKLNERMENLIHSCHENDSTLQSSDSNQSSQNTRLLMDLAQKDENWFQISWKVIVKQTIDDYETEFDRHEMINLNSEFRLDETLINKTDEYSNFYDRPDERRRQRWKFYLNNPPYWIRYHWAQNFMNLVKRIETSKYTKKEFSRALTILYKEISFSIFVEVMDSGKSITASLSGDHDRESNFVIPLLLADYTKTELITRIFNELGEENEKTNEK